MGLSSGDPVPQELCVVTPAGEEITLGSVLSGTDTLVIFLRHLG